MPPKRKATAPKAVEEKSEVIPTVSTLNQTRCNLTNK